jgi:hypothetical protein
MKKRIIVALKNVGVLNADLIENPANREWKYKFTLENDGIIDLIISTNRNAYHLSYMAHEDKWRFTANDIVSQFDPSEKEVTILNNAQLARTVLSMIN